MRSILIAGVMITLAWPSLATAEKLARLAVNVTVKGEETIAADLGQDHGAGRIFEAYTVTTTIKSDGELQEFNTKAPDYAEQMLARGQHVQEQVAKAQGKPLLTQEEMMNRLLKAQQDCGSDQQCLTRAVLEISQQPVRITSTPVALPATEPVPRYLQYYGYENCDAQAHVRINNSFKGEFADTQGMVPYAVERTADYRANAVEQRLGCAFYNLVVDTHAKTFFSDGVWLPEVKGIVRRLQRGQATEQSDSSIALRGDVQPWLQEQLRQAPFEGRKTTRLNLAANQSSAPHLGKYSGHVDVELSWKLEEIK